MSKVCLFGCGNVGMAAAHEIAMKAGFIEELVLCDIDKDTVDFVDNYDATMKERRI